ncbi:MAG TPA: transporter [Bacteroidota bacterium]
MKGHWSRIVAGATVLLFFGLTGGAHAQLSQQFTQIFNTILKDRMILNPGAHKNHYVDAAARAESLLTPSLNSLIVSNISSFPLTSTTPGVSFSFSGGELVSSTESLGPIFADRATTIGRGRFSFGMNATYLDLTSFRGLATDQMQFAFTHRDVNGDGIIGGNADSAVTEGDVINVTLGSHIKATIFAFYATYGITSNLDLGVAVPLIHVSISGTAHAVISSFTYANQGIAYHFFGGDSASPVLTTDVPYDQSATGLGDIAVRLKYCLSRGGADLGLLVDARLPTGKKDDFMGTGKAAVTVAGLLSKRIGDFAPHLNLGYEIRSAELQSSRVVVKAGFDQKLLTGMTFAADFLGTFDTQANKAIKLFPGTATIVDYSGALNKAIRTIPLSNIPDRNDDNLYNLSAGFRFAPSPSILFLANVLVPLNTGGLRAPVAPTVGFSMNL